MVLIQTKRALVYLILACFITACDKENAQQNTTSTTTQSTAARSCILSVGWGERTPFHYRAPDGSAFGIDIDVLNYLADKAGCALRYRYIPERQQMERLQSGDVELLIGQYQAADAIENTTYSDAYRTETYDLHVLSGSPVHRDDLSMLVMLDFKLGLNKGYDYDETVDSLREDLIHKSQFIFSDDSEVNVSRLLKGEVDGILEENAVVHAIADRELVDSQVERLDINGGSKPVFILFNSDKVAPEVRARFNTAIALMKKDGVYQQILDRHS